MTQGIIDANGQEVKRKEKGNISEANTAYHRKEIYLHACKPFG
jgi:hypothetical protein